MTAVPPPSLQPQVEVPVAGGMVSIPAEELAVLRRRANNLRVISRTVLGVVAIIGAASVIIVALAVLYD